MKPEYDARRVVDLRSLGEAAPTAVTFSSFGCSGHDDSAEDFAGNLPLGSSLPSLNADYLTALAALEESAPAKHQLVLFLSDVRASVRRLAASSGERDAWRAGAVLDALWLAALRSPADSGALLASLAEHTTEAMRLGEPHWNDAGPRTLPELARDLDERLTLLTTEGAIDAATEEPLGRRLTRWEVASCVLARHVRPYVQLPELAADLGRLAAAIYQSMPLKLDGGAHGRNVDADGECLHDPFDCESKPTVRGALRAVGYPPDKVNDATKLL